MTDECLRLATRLRAEGTKVIFDANVDYYTVADFRNIPADLVPSPVQRRQAIALTSLADSVMASSRYLASVCEEYHPGTHWIPDNVNMSLAKAPARPVVSSTRHLDIWWSGMPQKILDFLCIEDVLRAFHARIHLHLVTGDCHSAIAGMPCELAARVRSLFMDIPHTFHRFRSVSALLEIYAQARGVIISPRFLDNPYNLAHTEWKITLGMACGLPAIASPQPSYLDVAARCSHPDALRLCLTSDEWAAALERSIARAESVEASYAAREIVERRYSTKVVAGQHLQVVLDALAGDARPLIRSSVSL